MKQGNIPEGFTDLLALAQKCSFLSFIRDSSDLSIYFDDMANDRRTIIICRIKALSFELKTLYGYNKESKNWSDYCEPSGYGTFPNKRGEKALREWLAKIAKEKYFCENPVIISWSPPKNKP